MSSFLKFLAEVWVGHSLGSRVSVFPFALECVSGWSVFLEGRGSCEEPIQLSPLAVHSGQASSHWLVSLASASGFQWGSGKTFLLLVPETQQVSFLPLLGLLFLHTG